MRDVLTGIALVMIGFAASAATPPSVSSQPASGDSAWAMVGDSGGDVYRVRKDSFDATPPEHGKQYLGLLVQITNKASHLVTYGKWYVSNIDCDRGLGKVVMVDVNDNFLANGDYVSQGESAGSKIGDVICGAYKGMFQRKPPNTTGEFSTVSSAGET